MKNVNLRRSDRCQPKEVEQETVSGHRECKLSEAALRQQAIVLQQEIAARQEAQKSLLLQQEQLALRNLELEERLAAEVKKSHGKDQALLQSEKMASLGQLSASVAHEINSPMGFVAINLSVMAQYFERIVNFDRVLGELFHEMPPSVQDAISTCRTSLDLEFIFADGGELIAASQRGVERVKKITGDLKTFARMTPEGKEPTDLNSCLESALTIACNELKCLATIRKEYGTLPKFPGIPDQLSQVFLNLLINAGHAVVTPGEIVLRSWYDEAFVYASVADNGQGIPEEIRARIFEPFFTTKAVGKGTGLGLSITHEIIKKHNGELLVESEVGVGTTFTVKLPRIQE